MNADLLGKLLDTVKAIVILTTMVLSYLAYQRSGTNAEKLDKVDTLQNYQVQRARETENK